MNQHVTSSPTDWSAEPTTPPKWRRSTWPLWLFFATVFLIYLGDLPAMVLMMLGESGVISQQSGALLTSLTLLTLSVLAASLAPGRLTSDHLGLRGAPIRQVIIWTVIALVALYVPVFLGNAVSGSGSQDTSGLLGAGLANNLAMVLTVAAIGPLAEEVAFRGVLFRAAADGLARWLSPRVAAGLAMLASSFVFMVVHVGAPPWQLLAYFLFGVALCAGYWWTGSLLVALVPHLLNNAYACVRMALDAQAGPLVLAASILAPVLGVALALALKASLARGRVAAAQVA